MDLIELIRRPWPWYVAGPLIGLMVPLLLFLGNHRFGISPSLRHICAAALPGRAAFFRYDWKRAGGWNLALVAGAVLGGVVATRVLGVPDVAISPGAREQLAALGIHDFSGLVPREIFSWSGLLTLRGLVCVVAGGFLVGFGTAWAGGCTSGHGVTGLASLERSSLIAVLGFFAGGLLCCRSSCEALARDLLPGGDRLRCPPHQV
jgi:uncharacterized membrane protein YedE/YeeE